MTVRKHTHGWGFTLAIGIILMLIGLFALGATATASVVTVLYVGVMLIVVGALEILSAFRVRHTGGPFVAYILAGVLSIVVGGLFLDRPLVTLASLTLLAAGFFFVSGLFRGIIAVTERYPRWGLDLVLALVSIALGVIVTVTWPFSSFWVIGTLVGVEIFVHGATLVSAAWMQRDIEHKIPVSSTLWHGSTT
jgi:uncharacterized membrane protein HdeD (DUF308 family)